MFGIVALVGISAATAWFFGKDHKESAESEAGGEKRLPVSKAIGAPNSVEMTTAQQKAVGLKTAPALAEPSMRVLAAPGRVAPNELRFAYITPRAPGVVRSVLANIGQNVKAGELLATIDSPQVGVARLDLYTRLQALEIAKSQAEWQATIYKNTVELIERLRKQETPEEIHNAFQNRTVGENRERMMTAYAQFRLNNAKIERTRELAEQNLITTRQWEQVVAEFDVARSTYQSLMDQMGYEVKLANTRTQQALKQAETSVRAAKENLRILGVRPDGTEPEVESGRVIGLNPDGSIPAKAVDITPESILPLDPSKLTDDSIETENDGKSLAHVGKLRQEPVSTYSIWAPFDGTILDREMLVPGVAVDTLHRIFTIADLTTVWVEANIHENDFPELTRTGGGKVKFHSPAYPGRVFEGTVTYTGDLVEEKSRAIKLLAKADNPGRLLKPGMFVEVEIIRPGDGVEIRVPTSAVFREGSHTFLFIKTSPEAFLRRAVKTEESHGGSVTILKGVSAGDEIVVEGGAKLKSIALQMATANN